LFHNPLSIELVNRFFDFGTESFERLYKAIRFALFRGMPDSELGGLIFTLVWDYNFKEDVWGMARPGKDSKASGQNKMNPLPRHSKPFYHGQIHHGNSVLWAVEQLKRGAIGENSDQMPCFSGIF